MVYFDNAATTFPKPRSVINEVLKCIREYCGNPGRSAHQLSLKTTEKIYETREEIASYLNFDYPENVVFTQNATHGLNLSISGLIPERSHVITSDIEHNSTLRPLYNLVRQGKISLSIFDSDLPLEDAIGPLVNEKTKYLVINIASNATGKLIDLVELTRVARNQGLRLIIDASQYLGHYSINLKEIEFDAICAPGHKALFGIQGSGFVILNKGVIPKPLMFGGSGINSFEEDMPDFLPERLEAGTLNSPAIISMLEGLRYIRDYGEKEIKERIERINELLYDRISSLNLNIIGCGNGLISCNSSILSSAYISNRLSKDGIAIRSGIHCAPLIARKLGYEKSGTLRISASIFNSDSDIDILYKSLKEILK